MTKGTLFNQIHSNQHKTVAIMIGFFLIVAAFGTCLGWLVGTFSLANTNQMPRVIIKVSLITLLVVGIYALITMSKSINIVMAMNHGSEIHQRSEAPDLWDAVTNMAIAAGLPRPQIFIINDPAPNAFSTGNNPQHAAIGATVGLLKSMDKYEIEGVVGHEMSHIRDYDTRVETIGIALTSIFAFIGGLLWRIIWEASWFDWGDDDDDDDDDDSNGILIGIGIVLAIISWICAGLCYLTQMALSRNREYLADAGSVDLTRNPNEIIRALESLEKRPSMKAANPSSNALYIVNPHKPKHHWSIANLFDTHPPLDRRIARLKKM